MTHHLHVSEAEWDWNEMCWRVVITDDSHTWIGKSFLLSLAFLIALGRYLMDPDK